MLLSTQMRALSQWQGDLPAPHASAIAEGLTGLVRAVLLAARGTVPEPTSQRRTRGKVRALIERHYVEPTYTPAAAAAEMGISVRTLHAWLAQDGTSFGTELWAHRLECARRILHASPLLAVHEVASRCGFLSAAHLSRRFRERFGDSPSAWRNSA
jgi:AraC-like DNA-binding protein